MLDALLPGVRDFARAKRIWNVTDESHSLLLRLVGDGEITFAIETGEDLDEVDALRFQVADGGATLVRRGNRQQGRRYRLPPSNIGPAA